MKNRICVIFTGGTIGSEAKDGNVSLFNGSKRLLLEKYREREGDAIAFDVLNPINILSENVQPEDLQKLYDCVKGVNPDLYDGVIITHGTDTLCFTVNWFSRVFCAYPLPIVFVSALFPLPDPRSRGLTNFSAAVTFIEKAAIKGVYCSFTNGGEDCRIHLGSRLTYTDQISGFYHSALNESLATVRHGEITFNKSPLIPSVERLLSDYRENADARISSEIMLITMRSLLNFEVYDFTRVKPKAVIVELSHSGTVCTEGKELNFKRFAAYCHECGVQVVIAPVMSAAGVYASMTSIPPFVKVSYDTTIEMTIVKVMSALGAGLPAEAYFNENLFYEKVVNYD